MRTTRIDNLSLHTIMTRWPLTIRVFIDWRLHCVGCPIAGLHGIVDSALEHGYRPDELEAALRTAIETGVSPEAPACGRRQSAADDAGPAR